MYRGRKLSGILFIRSVIRAVGQLVILVVVSVFMSVPPPSLFGAVSTKFSCATATSFTGLFLNIRLQWRFFILYPGVNIADGQTGISCTVVTPTLLGYLVWIWSLVFVG